MYRAISKVVRRGSDELKKYSASVQSRSLSNGLFIWIPKTAGTSVFEMLRTCGFVKLKSVEDARRYFSGRGRVTFGHMSMSDLLDQGVVGRDFIDSAFVFTVVRNPYARAVSCFNHLNKRGYFSEWKRIPDFTEFLKIIQSGFFERVGPRNNRGLAFCNPQSEWLKGVRVDRIFKLESLSEDLDGLREAFRCPGLELGHFNRSGGLDVQSISPKDRALIEEIYQEDFERFGYR